MASSQQSDSTNGPPLRHRHQRYNTKNVHRKRLRPPTLTGLARNARPVSAALESHDFEHTQLVVLPVAPAKEREIRDADQEMADDRGTDDSNDEDYDDISDASSSQIGSPLPSRKRVKRSKDAKPSDIETPSTHSLNVSCQGIAATSSVSTQESEEIPIHRYLTLKTIESKVVYCLTFSQALLLEPDRTSQRQGIARSDSERLPVQERAISTPVRNARFSTEENKLLLQLKGEKGLTWDEISEHFPERSKGTLQVHYSTKLKPRSETSKHTRKRQRSE